MRANRLNDKGLPRSIAGLLGSGSALAIALTLATGSAAVAQTPAGPVVSVTGGRVQGRPMSGGGAVFKGIPYAAPPVGDLRWRETQPVKPWSGPVQAAEFRPGCGQIPDGSTVAEEDCLYLNVWAPDSPAAGKKPVMLWVNGGELFGGSGVLKAGAESLTGKGVVLVSANYRGTLLGMMGHPELTAESPNHASANYMLHDEVAVLKWIRANIAKFGGDPNNVTVFGQSGGGHVISMLLASPQTRGLIHRAVTSSGAAMQGPRPFLTLSELERIGTVTAEVLKAPATGQLKYLRSLPAADIVKAMPEVRARLLAMGGGAYDEGTDGFVIPQPPGEVWKAHKELPVPMIVGNTSLDTAGTIRGALIPAPGASPEAVAAYEKEALDLFYGRDPEVLQMAQKVYGLRGAPNAVSAYPPYGSPQLQLGVDLNHRCGTHLTAAWHSAIAPTWVFEFSRTTPGHLPTHSAELRYLFASDDLEDAAAREQSAIIQGYWTNFAKTGDPNGAGLPAWGKYDPVKQVALEFADTPIQRAAVRAEACAPYVEKYTRDPKPLTGGANTYIRGPAITANPR